MNTSKNLEKSKLTKEFVRSYIKDNLFSSSNGVDKIGIEIERFPVMSSKDHPYEGVLLHNKALYSGLLLDLAKKHKWPIISDIMENEHVIIGYKLPKKSSITFEPAKQIEYSTPAFDNFSKLVKDVDTTWDMIKKDIYHSHHLKYITLGSYPFLVKYPENIKIMDKLLVNKHRYCIMSKYYEKIGDYGQRMMNHTCANQVCVDTGKTPELVAKRYWVANLLAPLAHGIFAFSPYMDGKLTGNKSTRAIIVVNFDSQRTKISISDIANQKLKTMKDFEKIQFCVDTYTDLVLSSPLIYIERNGTLKTVNKHIKFKDWLENNYQNHSPTINDLKNQLGMVFPEVRTKGFYELRSCDGQATIWQYIPAIFYLSILSSEQCLDKALSILAPYASQSDKHWQLAQKGLDDKSFADLCQKIMLVAIDGLDNNTNSMIKSIDDFHKNSLTIFYENFTKKSRCPSDDLIHVLKKRQNQFSESVWTELINYWHNFK